MREGPSDDRRPNKPATGSAAGRSRRARGGRANETLGRPWSQLDPSSNPHHKRRGIAASCGGTTTRPPMRGRPADMGGRNGQRLLQRGRTRVRKRSEDRQSTVSRNSSGAGVARRPPVSRQSETPCRTTGRPPSRRPEPIGHHRPANCRSDERHRRGLIRQSYREILRRSTGLRSSTTGRRCQKRPLRHDRSMCECASERAIVEVCVAVNASHARACSRCGGSRRSTYVRW